MCNNPHIYHKDLEEMFGGLTGLEHFKPIAHSMLTVVCEYAWRERWVAVRSFSTAISLRCVQILISFVSGIQAHREGWGVGDTSLGPPNLFRERGPTRLLNEFFSGLHLHAISLSPLHCLGSMSEHLGRIISNTFGEGWFV